MNAKRLSFFLLIVATAAVFIGRGWQHLFWDAPYRALLWDQSMMESFIKNVGGMEWDDYVGSVGTDQTIQYLIRGIGGFYAIIALLVLFIPKRSKKWLRPLLVIGSLSLIGLALLYSKERFYQAAQFWEYTLQFSTPLLLAWWLSIGEWNKSMVFFMKIAIAITFISHGLYAAGVYPVPAHFSEMTMNILGTNEKQTTTFLQGIAVADFVASALLFTRKPLTSFGLWYCIVWGFMTTVARFWGNFNMDWWTETMQQWLYECIYRFPHFLIPLVVWLLSLPERKVLPPANVEN